MSHRLEVKKAVYLITSLGMNRHVAVSKPKHSTKQKICIWEIGAYLKQHPHSACCQGTKLQGRAVCYFRYHELRLQGTRMACQTCAEGKTECCLQPAGRSAWSLDSNKYDTDWSPFWSLHSRTSYKLHTAHQPLLRILRNSTSHVQCTSYATNQILAKGEVMNKTSLYKLSPPPPKEKEKGAAWIL